MIITIEKAILHIMDYQSGVTVFSDYELDLENGSGLTFITKHLEKSHTDTNLKEGTFLPGSKFQQDLHAYLADNLDFTSFSKQIATAMSEQINQLDKQDSVDLLVCDCMLDDQHLVAVLIWINRTGFVHHVVTKEAKVKSEIITHRAILPGINHKLDEFVFIDPSNDTIKLVEKKHLINGEQVWVLSERVLDCHVGISAKDVVKQVYSITQKVAEKHGENPAVAMSKAKSYILENIDNEDQLDPIEVGRNVFASSELLQKEYAQEITEAEIPKQVAVTKSLATKAVRNHKLKTDTGIELSIPVDYFENQDYLEFINNPDGTISIQLKNIGKITNR